MKIEDYEIFELHADFCKVIASPKRLMIIKLLDEHELSVTELCKALDVRPSNISQHLRVLRSRDIVKTRKEGQTVYYSLTNKKLSKTCEEIRSILLDGMRKQGEKAKGITGK